MPKIRLTRKFAQMINGIDLSRACPGEDIDVTHREADILIAEGWAEYTEERAVAEDKAHRSRSRKSES